MKRESLAERTLRSVQRLVESRGFSQETLAPHLGVSPSAVSKILSGKNALSLDHLEGFCVAFQISPAEMLVEPGSLIQPITPLESQLLSIFRGMTELQRQGLLTVLDRQVHLPVKLRRARLGRAELTAEQQLVIDLYARSTEAGRKALLSAARETAKHGDRERGLTRQTSE